MMQINKFYNQFKTVYKKRSTENRERYREAGRDWKVKENIVYTPKISGHKRYPSAEIYSQNSKVYIDIIKSLLKGLLHKEKI